MSEIPGSWVDGIPGASVPVDDRGLQYGDGLFETMLVRRGRVRFLELHLARLALGCTRLGIPLEMDAGLRAEIQAAAAPRDYAILKLLVTRGSGPRGYRPQSEVAARRVLTAFATTPMAPHEAVRLRVAQITLAANPALAGIKHLNRLENVLAASEPQHAACFESLLLDSDGQLVGGTMSNAFLVNRGRVVTPPVDRCGVAGIMRGVVLRECDALGIPAEVRPVAAAELCSADELFVTNARIGVVPAHDVGEHVVPMKVIATRLAAHIETLDA